MINAQRQKEIIFKGAIGLKQASLKTNMIKIQTMDKLNCWIDRNIKTLHKRYYDAFFHNEKISYKEARRYKSKKEQRERLKMRLNEIAQ